MEEDEPRPRPGCVGLLTDEEYEAVLLVRGLGRWGNDEMGKSGNEAPSLGGVDRQEGGIDLQHGKQLQDDAECEKEDSGK